VATYTWNGGSASAGDPNRWTLNGTTPAGPPGPNDSAIVTSGTVLGGNNTQLNNNTLYIGSAAFIVSGDTSVIYQFPSFDDQTVLTSAVPSASSAESSLLVATDRFVNQGTIDADGPAGSTFTIQVTTDGTLPGTFINYNQISVESGNEMVIAIAGTSELMNVGAIQVNGGTLVVNAATNAIAGGYAPVGGIAIIDGGGTLETNASYGTAVAGTPPYYVFADDTAGNTLKIDNIGSFGGVVAGFAVNDTIDLGTTLAVGKVVYTNANGLLFLENSAGTILASLNMRGNFQTGTFALSGSTAGSFNIGIGADGDTELTTVGTVQNGVYANPSSGVWQTGGNWSIGVPGTSDTAFIGVNAHTPVLLTTGTVPVTVGPLYLVDHHTTLQATSNLTINSANVINFGGTLEVTSGNTLTAQGLRQTDGSIIVDSGALIDFLGVPGSGLAAVNGTISVSNTNTNAVRMFGGHILVDGGTLNAAPGVSGGGGSFQIGYDGGGTPATVTVQNGGTVTDSSATVSSDPTSFGVLTLNGAGVSWTDAIDSHDTSTSSGQMTVGSDNVATNTPAGVPKPPFTSAATLLVENSALLTDQRSATIGGSIDSAGAVTIETGGQWTIGAVGKGGLNVGSLGDGSASILNGGTIEIAGTAGIAVGNSPAISGMIDVSGTNPSGGASALLKFDPATKGITVGNSGQGIIDVASGGTISLGGTGGLLLGALTGGSGTVSVTGPNALFSLGTAAGGISVGSAGQGTLDIENGGTFIENTNTTGFGVGISAGSNGLVIVNGANSVLQLGTNTNGIGLGQGSSGTLQVTNGGSVVIGNRGLNIGTQSSGQGTVTVSGTGSSITTQGTNGFINVGAPGNGVLNIVNGGSVNASSGVSIANASIVATGLINVNGGTLVSQNGINVGVNGAGTLAISGGGLVEQAGTFSLNAGFNAGSNGTITVNNGTLIDTTGFFSLGGGNASGTLQVGVGGTLTSGASGGAFSDINATGTGVAAATINGGTWISNSQIIVGDTGNGSLTINSNGIVNAGTNGLFIGNQTGGSGTVSVAGGALTTGFLAIDNTPTGTASGTLTVGAAGVVQAAAINDGGAGLISVNGGTLTATTLNVGTSGTGAAMTISSGGTVIQTAATSAVEIGLGFSAPASGAVTVNSGLFSFAGGMSIGVNTSGSNGTLTVNGGLVINTGTDTVQIGQNTGDSGTLVINGGTFSDASGFFGVGQPNANGTLAVNTGGTLITSGSTGGLSIINTSGATQAAATVGGGTWDTVGNLFVGDTGNGSLVINNNGIVNVGTTAFFNIGNQSGGKGTVTVSNGQLSSGNVEVAFAGGASGLLTVDAGGTVAAVASNGLLIGSGGTVVMAGGTVAANGISTIVGLIEGFGTLIAGANSNAGTIKASGGRLLVMGGIASTGADAIDLGSTLEVGGGDIGSSQSVSFVNGATNSALQLDSLSLTTQSFGLSDWQNGDELIIGNGSVVTGANWLNGASLMGTLEVDTNGGAYDFTNVSLAAGTQPVFNTGSNFVELVSCFAMGTHIASEAGELLVQTLRVGDRVRLASGELERVTWVGCRTIDCRAHPDPQLVWPVRIRAHAFGPRCPTRDLWLSPDHALFIDGVLIPAKHLIDGAAIEQVAVPVVTYYHIELTHHDVLLAEGLPAESYLADADLGAFGRRGEPVALFPDMASRVWEAEGCAPLVVAGPALEAARRRIARRRRAA
jgi:T5SS/PEP-CTERM-associated repeat protein